MVKQLFFFHRDREIYFFPKKDTLIILRRWVIIDFYQTLIFLYFSYQYKNNYFVEMSNYFNRTT